MSTTVLVYYLYQQAFQFHHFGYGATLSMLLFVDRAGADRRCSGRCAGSGCSMSRRGQGSRSTALLLRAAAMPFVFPTWWMVTSSLKPVSEIFAFPPSLLPADRRRFDAYRQVFELQPFAQQYWNSLYIAAVVTVGTLAVSSLAGYAFARIRFRGAERAVRGRADRAADPERGDDRAAVPDVPRARAGRHPLAADPGPDPRRAERAGDLHHAAVLHHAAGGAGGGRAASTGWAASAIFWRIALPLARPALGAVRSSPSCTAGTSTSSRSCSCPRRRSSPCPRR